MAHLWQRRSTGKQQFSPGSRDKEDHRGTLSRTYQPAKRVGSFNGKGNSPSSAKAAQAAANVTSPAPGASSAFGLGSGAFASFGSIGGTTKGPKSPGTGAESPLSSPTGAKKLSKERDGDVKTKDARLKSSSSSSLASQSSAQVTQHPLKSTWVVWYRPPTPKYEDYEKSTIAVASFSTAEAFWTVYSHLKHPSQLPSVSDYHIFKKGVRPVWEDEENKRGGKWIIRLKKGVADRYWEDLLLGVVGDQFAEAADEVCGAVLSIRSGEDVLSIWTRINGGRNIKIRETVKRLLALPADTAIIWKSHDDSIAQRSAIEQARQEKHTGGEHYRPGRRRGDTFTDESHAADKPRH